MNFFQRLFSQPRVEPVSPVQTPEESPQPTDAPQVESPPPPGLSQLGPGLHCAWQTDVGQEREHNEDSLYVVNTSFQHAHADEAFGLCVVADGMGGHQNGEVASALAARTAVNSILNDLYLPSLGNNPNANNIPLNEALKNAAEKANTAVVEEVPEGGTTLTLAVILGNNGYIAHVGDSRAYLFKENKLKQITQDHSLAKRLESLGQATAEEAAQVQNVLYRALGQSATIEVDTHIQHLPPGASILLCTDGLWGMVKDADIEEILGQASSLQAACNQLIEMANKNGGTDNITVILVSIGNKAE